MEEERTVPCTATEVCPGVLRFDDDTKASFYMIIGRKSAVVIDTGLSDGNILPVLRRYTELPLTLVITHGHGDHLSHANEFETAYLAPEDIPFLQIAGERLGLKGAFDPEHFLPLSDGQVLEFGDVTLEVIAVPGHSVGSVVFYCREKNLMFSGDAFGSGWSVFMQLPGGASLSEYRNGIRHFLDFCEKLPAEPEFMTGHFEQRYMTGKDNPVCVGLIRDMEELCSRVLDGKAELSEVSFFAHAEEQEYQVSYGRASMIVSRGKIR